ncbi:AlbA family DNA-binding domain-containing protein, partial [Glutamicibacter arilaitensis]|uniref:AlbA family DNA-binding domain-containing protein n=1 Tax=Glutamicibacter arilaitensis TaxID=256701 RepID=UPI003FCFFA45
MSHETGREAVKLSPVVVDARVDSAKLRELLDLASEYPELDFKKTLDLSSNSTKDNLSFIKDALSMSNSTHGGYLVIGATEDGKPAHDCSPIDPAHFDSAILKDKVSAYVADHVSIASKIHLVEGRSIALIYVGPPSDKIPHVTTKEGK